MDWLRGTTSGLIKNFICEQNIATFERLLAEPSALPCTPTAGEAAARA
jgi:hypothetical protein